MVGGRRPGPRPSAASLEEFEVRVADRRRLAAEQGSGTGPALSKDEATAAAEQVLGGDQSNAESAFETNTNTRRACVGAPLPTTTQKYHAYRCLYYHSIGYYPSGYYPVRSTRSSWSFPAWCWIVSSVVEHSSIAQLPVSVILAWLMVGRGAPTCLLAN